MRTFASILAISLWPLGAAAQDPVPVPDPEPLADPAAEGDEQAGQDLEGEADAPEGEFGPFYEGEPDSEVHWPTPKVRPGQPLLGVGGGAFCFGEDAGCKASLLADFDFGVGMNIVGSDRGIDVAYTQWRVRGGFTVRPFQLARERFHPWGVGLTVSYSQGSPQIATGRGSSSDPFADVEETGTLEGLRISMIHQIWLSQRRNALHVDLSVGGVQTTVFDAQGRFWGTHAEVAVGWGPWASFFGSADFLDRDLRAVFGFRTHAMVGAPVFGLLVLGLLAGGAL